MNDFKELQFGASIFERSFREAAMDPTISPDVRALVGRLANIVSEPDPLNMGNLRCFAACFCESGDLLSQWRGYAGGVGGFAVGFSRDALVRHSYVRTADDQWAMFPRAELKPVMYGDDAGQAAADGFIRLLQNPASQPGLMQASINDPDMGFWIMLQYVVREIAVIKHRGFSDEKEWRLFWSGDCRWYPKMRARASGLVPYVDVAVNAPQYTAFFPHLMEEADGPAARTIAAVIVGPGPNQSGQVVATRDLVRAGGNDPDVVQPSVVPYRG